MRLTRRKLAAAVAATPTVAALLTGRASAAEVHEVTLGDAEAPVTIIEYFSLTCPHCAHFATNTLTELKKQYIDTGKVKLVLRDFPLDQIALKAAVIAHCAGDDHYPAFVEEMFKTQASWEGASDPVASLRELAKLGGLTDKDVDACLADKSMENAVLQSRLDAQNTYQIDSTPTFIINDKKYSGDRDIKELAAIIDPLLK